MPICPVCRSGYENSESQCPRCGAPKPTETEYTPSPRLAVPSGPNWSVNGLPYKLFGLAALVYYVAAITAVLGVLFSLALSLGLVSYGQGRTRLFGGAFLLEAIVQVGAAGVAWGTALAFRMLRMQIRTARRS